MEDRIQRPAPVIMHKSPREPERGKWQTRRTQNPVTARSCGFDSHLRHQFLHSDRCTRVSSSLGRSAVALAGIHLGADFELHGRAPGGTHRMNRISVLTATLALTLGLAACGLDNSP